MTDTEYTKGPWVLVQDEKWPFGFTIKAGDFPVIVASRYSTGSNQSSIAENRDAVGFNADERESVKQGNLTQDANLRMAAAAPDMYEALKAAKIEIGTYLSDLCMGAEHQLVDWSLGFLDVQAKINAALSKAHPSAEGE